jgi:ribosomal protein S27AE
MDMIKTSEIDNNNNILNAETCMACGHRCNKVYIVKDNSIKDMQQHGAPFRQTELKVAYETEDNTTQERVYMCPNCGVLQTEVIK